MLERLRQIGPAIVVAAVVLGPGSITTSTKIGAAFGYNMLWLLVILCVLLIGVASLAAWLGATLERSLCSELSARLGPWAGWVIGIALFLIVAGFQSSNNIAVIGGIEPLLQSDTNVTDSDLRTTLPFGMVVTILVVINLLIIGLFYIAGDLYKRIEVLMKILILLMIAAFLINLFFAKPSLAGILGGLVPDFTPFSSQEHSILIMGLIATTFSVAGAFYQGYLVREKGWGPSDVKKGFFDSVFGMCVLAGVTSIIMITSAAAFHGKVAPGDLGDAGKMSAQLKASMGDNLASWVFCFGFLAGAFSSFLVNAMIGGHVFADGIGRGGSLKSKGARAFTAIALLIGMLIGIAYLGSDFDRTTTIVIAQASTVIGGPAVVAGLLYLGWRMYFKESTKPPLWMLIMTSIAMVVTLFVATTTAKSVVGKIQKITQVDQ